ncbi:MAG: hypothetical protein ACK4OF_04115, partial [Aquificaceae bacterium]
MVRDALKLLFLIVSYNFILRHLAYEVLTPPLPIFPYRGEDMLMLFSISSALYLSWLFGYKERTVAWLAYVSLFQVIGLSILRQEPYLITQFVP